jgi:nitrite reductase/ring-hydroxylating ferredoxin subunit
MPISDLFERLTRRIETATALDPASERLRDLGSKGLKPERVRDLLSGRPIGHPLHPSLVLVSGGSLLSATFLDTTGGAPARAASRRLIVLGLLSAIPTALAGWSDWLDTEQAEGRAGIVHAAANSAGLLAYAQSWNARRRGHPGTAGSLVGAAALGIGGWLGGHLTFGQGIGVDTTAFQGGPTDWTDVAAAEEITDKLQQVSVGGVALLLTRVDGEVVGYADRCTHRGAPLSDGSREADCVTCPWHDSVFSLRTGQVVTGPATRPQPAYETRERSGRIEVRRQEARALRLNPVGA